jgi:hypothetical protein
MSRLSWFVFIWEVGLDVRQLIACTYRQKPVPVWFIPDGGKGLSSMAAALNVMPAALISAARLTGSGQAFQDRAVPK